MNLVLPRSEYGLIAAGISLAIIAVVNGLGTNLNEKIHLDQQLAEIGPVSFSPSI
jgi:hypothetical protein